MAFSVVCGKCYARVREKEQAYHFVELNAKLKAQLLKLFLACASGLVANNTCAQVTVGLPEQLVQLVSVHANRRHDLWSGKMNSVFFSGACLAFVEKCE